MAAVAGLGALVDDVAEFSWLLLIADPPLLVEDADPYHPRLIRHGRHGVIHASTIVPQHVVGSAALDDIADKLGAGEGCRLEVLAVQLNVEISEKSKNNDHYQKQQADQLGAKAVRQPIPLSSSWLNLRHGPTPALH